VPVPMISGMGCHGGDVRAAVIFFSLIASSIADDATKVVAGTNSWRCLVTYKYGSSSQPLFVCLYLLSIPKPRPVSRAPG